MIRTVWIAFLLSACGPWGLKEDGDSGEDSNEGMSADLDGDSDTDTDADTDSDTRSEYSGSGSRLV